jgi:hypothetical protein
MDQFEAVITTLNEKLDKLDDRMDRTQDGLNRVASELVNLPENFVQREEAEIRTKRVRNWLIGLGMSGLLVATTLGVTLYTTHQTTCGVRSVLLLAKSAANRNPIPPDLPPDQLKSVEDQRAKAAEFYTNALQKLPVLWGC